METERCTWREPMVVNALTLAGALTVGEADHKHWFC